MEQITKNTGLQHIGEEVFKHLDKENLMNCRKVNQSWKNILEGPMFLLKRIDNSNIQDDIKKNWKMLIKEHEKENLDQTDFDFFLENIFETKPKNPLKLVLELAEAEKLPNLVKFMLEYMDQKASINAKVTFRRSWREPAWIFGLTPLHVGALYGKKRFANQCQAKKNHIYFLKVLKVQLRNKWRKLNLPVMKFLKCHPKGLLNNTDFYLNLPST